MKEVMISKQYYSYNGRRYGRPWVARIISFSGRPELMFINKAYNGDDNGGELYFSAEIGEVIKIGQKDTRGTSANDFYYINMDGKLEYIASSIDARKLWEVWQNTRINTKI